MKEKTRFCPRCKRTLPVSEFSVRSKDPKNRRFGQLASYCKECTRENAKTLHWENREEILKRKRGYRGGSSREEYLRKQREYRANIRLKALKHISINGIPECSVCGFKEDIRFLQIDHINDDGYIERGGRGHTCDNTYFRILRMTPEKARERYQILCVLHNYTKKYGVTGKEFKVVRA